MERIPQTATGEPDNSYTCNYSQTTLPHLLVEYGLKDQTAAQQKKRKDAEKERNKSERKQVKTFGSFINAHEEQVRKRKTEKEEYYLKLVHDMHRLRDHYYKMYTQRLSEKVKRQQEEIKERDIDSKEKREQMEEEKRKASHKLKKRLEHHTLDTSIAAKNVPKTDLYYIVGLEEKLLREGKLKTMTDYNTFWMLIQDPQVFYTNFKVQKSTDGSTNQAYPLHPASSQGHNNSVGVNLPWTAQKQPDRPHPSQKLLPLGQITKLRKSSRPDNWAAAQQYPVEHKKRASVPGFQTSKTKQGIHLGLDKRFPKVEMPKLHCFDINLTSKPPDPDQVQQMAKLRAKEKHRKRLMRQVAKMYQLAMSNVATSARILDQHEHMDIMFKGPDLRDVIADVHWSDPFKFWESEASHKVDDQNVFEGLEAITEESQSDGRELIQEEQGLVEAIKEQDDSDGCLPQIRSRSSSSVSASIDSEGGFCKSSDKSRICVVSDDKELPLPLTMEEIRDNCNIVEAKSLSTFWRNYMGVGQ